MKILVTGAAGFVGMHLCKRLLNSEDTIYGIDTINDYYNVQLKFDRLKQLESYPNFQFSTINICDKDSLDDLFRTHNFDYVINLAAQAGVRYSIDKPYKYIDSNLIGFINVLEACRRYEIKHLLFASSSSVYGANSSVPFSTNQATDSPISLYGATKKANELMAHSYASLYGISCTGLRFFTVYGPWGRPDMAYFLFTKAIMEEKTIKVFNHGKMKRDFTFIDDIVESIVRLLPLRPTTPVPYKIYNIGNNNPVELGYFIETIEQLVGKEAKKEYLPMQQGDMVMTYADIDDLVADIDFAPQVSIEDGLTAFVEWYKSYYGEK